MFFVKGLLRRREKWSVLLKDEPKPPRLYDPSDVSFLREVAFIKERDSALAVAQGLPRVGSRMMNAHGIEWVVDGHTRAPSVATLGCSEETLYPVVVPQNLGPRIDAMLQVLHLCTPKEFVPLDTVPHLRPNFHAPLAHSVDSASDPNRILLFLDVARLHETVLAHELGHVWIELVENVEDDRVLRDLGETARYTQVQHLQSFVLDQRVNGLVESRGFDMAPIVDDRRVSLEQLALAVAGGYLPPTPWEGVFMATALAETMLEGTTHPARADDAMASLRTALPSEWALAQSLTSAVREHPPTDRETAAFAINRVLILGFAHAGEHLDFEQDLISVPPSIAWRDKWPGWLPGLPPQHKVEVGKAMARAGYGLGTHARLSSANGIARAEFSADLETWSEPISLPFRLPGLSPPGGEAHRIMEINAIRRKRQQEKGVAPTMCQEPSFLRRRAYSTGLARFLTQVRMEEMLEGEYPYTYAFDNPTTYTDPSGDYPEVGGNPWTHRGKCSVKVCTMYGFASQPWIVTHQYTCAVGSTGKVCSGGLGPGPGGGIDNDQNRPCKTGTVPRTGGGPPVKVECRERSTNCDVAAAVCNCLSSMRGPGNHPPFCTGRYCCINYAIDVRWCACQSLRGNPKAYDRCMDTLWSPSYFDPPIK